MIKNILNVIMSTVVGRIIDDLKIIDHVNFAENFDIKKNSI